MILFRHQHQLPTTCHRAAHFGWADNVLRLAAPRPWAPDKGPIAIAIATTTAQCTVSNQTPPIQRNSADTAIAMATKVHYQVPVSLASTQSRQKRHAFPLSSSLPPESHRCFLLFPHCSFFCWLPGRAEYRPTAVAIRRVAAPERQPRPPPHLHIASGPGAQKQPDGESSVALLGCLPHYPHLPRSPVPDRAGSPLTCDTSPSYARSVGLDHIGVGLDGSDLPAWGVRGGPRLVCCDH